MALIFILLLASVLADDARDYEFSEPDELLIAQESRHYETVVKPPVTIVKPSGVTNSHRPQYNLDSLELDDDLFMYESNPRKSVMRNYKQTRRVKEGMVRDAVLRALDRKDQVGKFAQILPIIRTMSGNQRVALASLVANQVTTPPGRQPMNLSQVRSMFGNDTISDPMLPILLDTANLIQHALRHGKEIREVKPRTQFQRRSISLDTLDENPFETGEQENNKTLLQMVQRNRNFRNRQPPTFIKTTPKTIKLNTTNVNIKTNRNNTNENTIDTTETNLITTDDVDRNITRESQPMYKQPRSMDTSRSDNITLDLAVEASNQSISEEIPVAEKLRSLNRYVDRKGNLLRRGTYPLKPSPPRRAVAEPTITPVLKRRPIPPVRKTPQNEQAKCELFTNTLCLHTDDYPTEAIVQTIRRNKAAAGALLADFQDPGEGAVDGITAAQEAKYTAEHYLVSNRRGDTANRDFAGAGEAGFMCPSTVKYARPQRARATSGQWKYIVNTGEHTQTLRLEKCLKPKESCTYLTDNFKSKCVQVYNYHRLLTWDQQNGLHMDIFKVPTCCSCHIEGYSVSFPPLGHRVHETSSENFPGEDLSSEHGNQAFETVQSTMQKPSIVKNHPLNFNKPIEGISAFTENHNFIPGSSLSNVKLSGSDDLVNLPTNPVDSYGNTYFPDSFNQASSVRNIKRPVPRTPAGIMGLDSVTLPSYLEPPTPRGPSPFSFSKDVSNKYKTNDNQFKRAPLRPSRRPLRKKTSSGPDDLISSGSSSIGSYSGSPVDSLEEFPDESEETENENFNKKVTIAPKLHSVTTDINYSTFKPSDQSQNNILKQDYKKVNYNYHPIIDFFEDQDSDSDSIDREDNIEGYVMSPESEWKPIGHPPSRSNINTSSRKKHK